MIDTALRARMQPRLEPLAYALNRNGVSAGAITAIGLLVGIGACIAAASEFWAVAAALWIFNRALDGLDGAVARLRGPTDFGGMVDLLSDFVVYGGFVVAVAIALPEARIASTVLLAAYLLNNVALLSFASLVEKRGLDYGDDRSLRFTSGLTEGTETIVAYLLICLFPRYAPEILWVFAAMVLFTVVQRVLFARRVLDRSS